MVDVVCIPYNSFKEKIHIMKENKDIRFTDLGNVLIHIENIEDEKSAYRLCKEEWNKV